MALSDSERSLIKEAFNLIQRETANDGDALVFRGFGTFTRKVVAAKTGRNPKTGVAVQIPAKSVLRFKASSAISQPA